MTADEFNAALEQLDLSHHAAADRLGMGRHGWQSVRDWSRGERDVPGPVALALQLLGIRTALHGANDRLGGYLDQDSLDEIIDQAGLADLV